MANQTKALKNLFTGLPLWAKGILALLVVGIVIYIAFQAKGILKNITEKIAENKAKEEVKDELKDYAKQGVTPSYPDSQYRIWCDTIWNALDGIYTGSSAYTPLYAVFERMKNDADVLKLISIYGVREIDAAGALWKNLKDLNLPQAMANESFLDINKINNILISKGIEYRF